MTEILRIELASFLDIKQNTKKIVNLSHLLFLASVFDSALSSLMAIGRHIAPDSDFRIGT